MNLGKYLNSLTLHLSNESNIKSIKWYTSTNILGIITASYCTKPQCKLLSKWWLSLFPGLCHHGSAWGAGIWACFEFWSAPDAAFIEEWPEWASLLPHRLSFLFYSTANACLWKALFPRMAIWQFVLAFCFFPPEHLLKQNVWFTVGREGERDFWQVEKWKKSELCSLACDRLCVCVGGGR